MIDEEAMLESAENLLLSPEIAGFHVDILIDKSNVRDVNVKRVIVLH